MNQTASYPTKEKERYLKLKAIHMMPARTEIIEQCGITKDIFFNYMNGKTPIPKLASEKIDSILTKFEALPA